VLFVLLVYLSLANEDMVEGLLNQHVKDIIVFVFEEQIYQASEELCLTDLLVDLHAGN
jgi:hypothetical protein